VRRRALFLALAALAAAAGGCGSSGSGAEDPGEALSQTAAKLGDIRSGELKLEVIVDPREEGGEFGFELAGPFQLAEEEGRLPTAQVEYTQLADGERETTTVTLTGEKGYITVDGETYELDEDQLERLRAAAPAADGEGGSEGLEVLRIDDWLREPESSGGDEVGGDSTDRVEAELDVVAAVNDLMALVGGAAGSEVSGDDARLLRESVRNPRLEVLTGSADRLLRRLRITAEFDPELPEELSELARAAGADVEFLLEIANPNEPVEVEAPEDVRPSSELGG
jgi:hypothetical protein